MIGGLAQRATAPLAAHAKLILSRAMLAAVAVAVARTAIDLNADPARGLVASLPQSGRWLMVWLGYYLAGCAVFLALRSERFLAWQDRRSAQGRLGKEVVSTCSRWWAPYH